MAAPQSLPNVLLNLLAADPEIADLLNLFSIDLMKRFKCHDLGTIESFDVATQTAKVSINYKRTFAPKKRGGKPRVVEYPALVHVPVHVAGGGGFRTTYPIAQGDTCLVAYNDRDFSLWFANGQVGPVASARMHDLSDGIAVVGVRHLGNVIIDYDPDRAALGNGQTMVAVGPTLVKIANATYTLNGLLQELTTELHDLVTAVSAITVTPGSLAGPSSVPLNAAAIAAVGARITATAAKIGGLLE